MSFCLLQGLFWDSVAHLWGASQCCLGVLRLVPVPYSNPSLTSVFAQIVVSFCLLTLHWRKSQPAHGVQVSCSYCCLFGAQLCLEVVFLISVSLLHPIFHVRFSIGLPKGHHKVLKLCGGLGAVVLPASREIFCLGWRVDALVGNAGTLNLKSQESSGNYRGSHVNVGHQLPVQMVVQKVPRISKHCHAWPSCKSCSHSGKLAVEGICSCQVVQKRLCFGCLSNCLLRTSLQTLVSSYACGNPRCAPLQSLKKTNMLIARVMV